MNRSQVFLEMVKVLVIPYIEKGKLQAATTIADACTIPVDRLEHSTFRLAQQALEFVNWHHENTKRPDWCNDWGGWLE